MTELFRLSGMTRHLLPAFQFNPSNDDPDEIPPAVPHTRNPNQSRQETATSKITRTCSETRPHTHHSKPCRYEFVPLPFAPRLNIGLNLDFHQHLEDLNGLQLEHCKGVQDYADQLWGVYKGMLGQHPPHAIIEAMLKTLFLDGLDERFQPWREWYLQEKQIVPESIFDPRTADWEEVVLAAIAEEARLDRLEARAAREAAIAAEEEERQRARVNEETTLRTIRTFDELPASSIPSSSRNSVVETQEETTRREVIFQDELKQQIAPTFPRLEAWLEGADVDVVDIPEEEDDFPEEENESEIEEVPVSMPVAGSEFVVEETPSEEEEDEEEDDEEDDEEDEDEEDGSDVVEIARTEQQPPFRINVFEDMRTVLGRRQRNVPDFPPMPTGDHITVMWRRTGRARAVRQPPLSTEHEPSPEVLDDRARGLEIPETDPEEEEDDDEEEAEEEEEEEEEEKERI